MGSTEEISISQNPLNCVIEGISLNLPLEVINLQCCDMLQSKYQEFFFKKANVKRKLVIEFFYTIHAFQKMNMLK